MLVFVELCPGRTRLHTDLHTDLHEPQLLAGDTDELGLAAHLIEVLHEGI